MSGSTPAATIRLIALGDSLTAGYGLPADSAFPVRLEQALRRRGYAVTVLNAGISGDTTAGGLARVDAVIAAQPDGVILELGTNDALYGLPEVAIRANLDATLARLSEAGIPVLLSGARDLGGRGPRFAAALAAVYAELAQKYNAVLDPFFLEGAYGRRKLFQPDGLHPNAAGVDVIVARLVPTVETFLSGLGAKPAPKTP